MNVGASNDWIQQLYVREFGPKLQPNQFYYDNQGRIVLTKLTKHIFIFILD